MNCSSAQICSDGSSKEQLTKQPCWYTGYDGNLLNYVYASHLSAPTGQLMRQRFVSAYTESQVEELISLREFA